MAVRPEGSSPVAQEPCLTEEEIASFVRDKTRRCLTNDERSRLNQHFILCSDCRLRMQLQLGPPADLHRVIGAASFSFNRSTTARRHGTT